MALRRRCCGCFGHGCFGRIGNARLFRLGCFGRIGGARLFRLYRDAQFSIWSIISVVGLLKRNIFIATLDPSSPTLPTATASPMSSMPFSRSNDAPPYEGARFRFGLDIRKVWSRTRSTTACRTMPSSCGTPGLWSSGAHAYDSHSSSGWMQCSSHLPEEHSS